MRMLTRIFFILAATAVCQCKSRNSQLSENEPELQDAEILGTEGQGGSVMTDYSSAYNKAREEKKMLYVYFYNENASELQKAFETKVLNDGEVKTLLERGIFVKVPTSNKNLFNSGAFRDLLNSPGVAAIDLMNESKAYYTKLVGIYPLNYFKHDDVADSKYEPYNPEQFKVFLQLPAGSLTQRTLIFVIRTHPLKPQSTNSTPSDILIKASEDHSLYQAKIGVQGHHNWESRFHQLNAALNARYGGHHTTTEIVAESWPGQGLLQAAYSCVHSWRHSSGHWAAVVAKNKYYGYDMRHQQNGISYCTGLFGK